MIKMPKDLSAEYELIQTSKALPINIFRFQARNLDRIIPKHWHPNIELIYCVKGQLNVWIGSTFYSMKANDLLVINSNVIHSTQSPQKNQVIVLQIAYPFLEEATKGYYKEFYDFKVNTLVNNPDTYHNHFTRIRKLLLSMLKHGQEEYIESNLKVMSSLYELMYILIKYFKIETKHKTSVSTSKYIERMSSIIEYLKEHYKYDVSLSETARKFNFSPPYFSRFFKKYMGITFSEYVTSLRMEEAYKLLMETDQKITEIAMSTGFANVKSFSTQFDKTYHSTPHQHRKKYK